MQKLKSTLEPADFSRAEFQSKINKIGFISGFAGNWVYVQDIQGNYLQTTPKYKQINTEKINLVCRNNNWITDSSSTFAYA